MSELTISQQAAILALTLWTRGYRSHFQLSTLKGGKLSTAGSAGDCLHDYQWLCRLRGDSIADFRLVTHERRGSSPESYRFEFDVSYSGEKGFHLYQFSVYSTAGKIHEQGLASSLDLPYINQLLPAQDIPKRKVTPPQKRGRHP